MMDYVHNNLTKKIPNIKGKKLRTISTSSSNFD